MSTGGDRVPRQKKSIPIHGASCCRCLFRVCVQSNQFAVGIHDQVDGLLKGALDEGGWKMWREIFEQFASRDLKSPRTASVSNKRAVGRSSDLAVVSGVFQEMVF